ncbi:MAG: cdd [Gammaproteobacteria bacterium]|jgi:cytidine deaminase|nr:cdd [Gammaproteobacteria bacterium]
MLEDTERDHMLQLAKSMLEKAYAPYSNFTVGACLKTAKGNYYHGCNIENVSYSLVQCAEACAIANMVSQGEQAIKAAVIVSSSPLKCAPCGACRQRLREFSQEDLWVYMFDRDGNYTAKLLSELLPDSFGPDHMELML